MEVYYQTRKSDVISSTPPPPVIPSETSVTTATAASIESIEKAPKIENEPVGKKIEPQLISILTTITGRSKKEIQASLEKLERRDFLRLNDLCKNYNKIQKYSKLITEMDVLQKFKTELENDVGRKLSSHQIQHAANSIRKTKLYIENVLDGKYIPHGSYGINHIKHNLEYGYLIVGLMQSSRKGANTNERDMKEIKIKLTNKEYEQYVKKGRSEYLTRMKKAIEDEEYVRWMFMLGEYYRGQRG